MQSLANQYPNAIIFYKAFNTDTNLEESSIWAHGKEYKTGGGNTHYKISSTLRVTDADETTGAIDSWTPELGDIFVEKKIISGGGTQDEKAEYTAYVWSLVAGGSAKAWRALDGNYNAENVYFTNNITLAGNYSRVGNVTKTDNNATGTLSAAGKSVKQLFESIFTKEIYPAKPSKSQTATLTASVTAPTPVIKDEDDNEVETNSLLAVGTTGLVLQSATAAAAKYGGTESTIVSGFTYGYASDKNGTGESEDTSISAARSTPSAVSGDTYSLVATITKFSSTSSDNTITATANSTASNVVTSSKNLGAVESGENIVTLTETGVKFTASVGAIPEKFVKSNIGNYSDDHKSDPVSSVTLTSDNNSSTSGNQPPTSSKSIKIYGCYPIVINGVEVTASNPNGDGAYNDSNYETTESISLSTTYTVSNGVISPKTFYVGFGAQENKYWDIYIPSIY